MSEYERINHVGFTIVIEHDDDCGNPRAVDPTMNASLFLGLRHRRYAIGDEELDLDDYCDADGGHPASVEELMDAVAARHDAAYICKVGMIDHSGVAYYFGGGASASDPGGWDSGTCGFLLYPRAMLAECGLVPSDVLDDAKFEEWARGEIQEYSDWASGNCYGYRILDCNGDEVDACWGFIGDPVIYHSDRKPEDAWWLTEARQIAERHHTVVPLHVVQFTDVEIDHMRVLLAMDSDLDFDALDVKLQNARREAWGT